MEDIYKALYLRTFNCITSIIREMEVSGCGEPQYIKILNMLKMLQISAEEAFICVED